MNLGFQRHWAFIWITVPMVMLYAVWYAWQQFFYPTYHFRFKLTVEVQTPEGVKTASVVNEDLYEFTQFGKEFMPSSGGALSRGEALFIDLGNQKNLVVTTIQDDYRTEKSGPGMSAEMGRLPLMQWQMWKPLPIEFRAALDKARKQGVTEISIGNLPMLITFTDLSDYKSIQRLEPREISKALGPGYEIKRATLEIADEPLTERIEGQLVWLAQFKNLGTAFDGSSSAGPGTSLLSHLYYGTLKYKNPQDYGDVVDGAR